MENSQDCRSIFLPIRDTLDVVGGKWKLPIIHMLALNGPMRFNELQQELLGITPRMLSRELQELDLNGLIVKEPENQAVVRYKLTTYGLTLEPVVKALYDWGQKHRTKVMGDARSNNV